VITDNPLSAENQQERVPKNEMNLNYYFAGFVDGEGTFTVSIHRRNVKSGIKWVIDPFFQVYQHKDNSFVLFLLRDKLKCGYVSEKGGNPSCFVYCVDKIQNLIDIIIPFFEKYPIIGKKYDNFLLFREIVYRLKKKEHLTKEGFVSIAKLCFKMNRNGYYRKNSLETIISSLEQSSETIC
jgi:hypothetical protein